MIILSQNEEIGVKDWEYIFYYQDEEKHFIALSTFNDPSITVGEYITKQRCIDLISHIVNSCHHANKADHVYQMPED